MQAGEERAVAPQAQTVEQLWQADEEERQKRPAVPLVVEEDVQVVQRVLVQEVGLVEEEDGVDAAEVADVRGDGVEDGRRRRL